MTTRTSLTRGDVVRCADEILYVWAVSSCGRYVWLRDDGSVRVVLADVAECERVPHRSMQWVGWSVN